MEAHLAKVEQALVREGAVYVEELAGAHIHAFDAGHCVAVMEMPASEEALRQSIETIRKRMRAIAKLLSFKFLLPGSRLEIVVVGGDETARPVLASFVPRWFKGRMQISAVHVVPGAAPWFADVSPQLARVLIRTTSEAVVEADAQDPVAERAASELKAFIDRVASTRPVMTTAFVVLLVVIYLSELLSVVPGGARIARLGALSGSKILTGEVWRSLSYALLHAHPLHIFLNASALLLVGAFCERWLGAWRTIAVFTAATIGAAIPDVLLIEPSRLSVGASGGIYGLLGVTFALAIRPGALMPATMAAPVRRGMRRIVTGMIIASLLPLVSARGHLGGFATGFLLGISGVLARGRPEAWRKLGIASAAALALSFVVAIAVGRPWHARDRDPWIDRDLDGTYVIGAPLPPTRIDGPGRVYAWGDQAWDGLVVRVRIDEKTTLESSRSAIAPSEIYETRSATPERFEVALRAPPAILPNRIRTCEPRGEDVVCVELESAAIGLETRRSLVDRSLASLRRR